ncbi:HEAT repeat domain-containing protein [Candidatus Allofournierella merdavium]|uniref:HEAT repeat domain-containing protein n=1 Tax=Candidatus Allofournierella merdavium TaxID=2838593 RepID=UPI00374EE6C9
MTIQQIIDDKSIKRLEKRNAIVEGILNRSFDFSAVSAACSFLPEKKIALLLEAIEEVSRSKEFSLEEDYLNLSERYILSSDPSCKREASRIVGNLAAAFPAKLDHAIAALLQNANDDGTVTRWASAYALSRIVILPQYAKGPLFEQICDLCEKETESGVRNQYGKALKKAERIR